MSITTIGALTGYAQEAKVVTTERVPSGYLGPKPEVPVEALFVLLAALAALIAVDLTTIDWDGTHQGS